MLCYGDRDASVVAAAALQLGLRIPEDISIVLCADEPFVRMGLRFTTLVVPAAVVGAEAVRMMLRKVERPNDRLPRRAIPFELHAGGTSAPPPGAPSSRARTV
jgi:DNA-binding LacI/PurR family transcriptional regulator